MENRLSTETTSRRERHWERPLPAVHSDWSVLSKLLLGFVHLANEIDESLPGFWHSLLGPVGELELANGPGLAILWSQ